MLNPLDRLETHNTEDQKKKILLIGLVMLGIILGLNSYILFQNEKAGSSQTSAQEFTSPTVTDGLTKDERAYILNLENTSDEKALTTEEEQSMLDALNKLNRYRP